MALVFLSFENLPSEDRPERAIWFDGEAMKDWFATVDARNRAKYGGDDMAPPEDKGMERNAFLDEFYTT